MVSDSTKDLVAAAVKEHALEEQTGPVGPTPALAQLAGASDPEGLLHDISHLRSGDASARQIHARELAECNLPAGRMVDELRHILAVESEPMVLYWVVVGFRYVRTREALADLRTLARHDSADVRVPVPDAMSACARSFDEIADDLVMLSRDPDADVRWSATFELAAWWSDTTDPRIRRRLVALNSEDASDEVRALAAQALGSGQDE